MCDFCQICCNQLIIAFVIVLNHYTIYTHGHSTFNLVCMEHTTITAIFSDNDTSAISCSTSCEPYHVLVAEVCDETVRMVMLSVIEREEWREIVPVSVILVSHMISNAVVKDTSYSGRVVKFGPTKYTYTSNITQMSLL